jgi:hypothetical protein
MAEPSQIVDGLLTQRAAQPSSPGAGPILRDVDVGHTADARSRAPRFGRVLDWEFWELQLQVNLRA